MRSAKPLRVLHCPTDTGRNAWTLARAERELGLHSDVMVWWSSWLQYPTDIDLHFKERSNIGKGTALLGFLARAAARYDVFHFNCGSSIFQALPPWLAALRQTDVAMLHALGKGIVVTYQGCEARQCDYCVENMSINACGDPDCREAGGCTDAVVADRAHRVEVFDRHAHAIFSLNPDLLRVLPERARFLPYTTIDPREWQPVASRFYDSRPFVILHAPTNRAAKGTRHIVAAVEALAVRFPNVTLRLVEGIPHSEVRSLYESADLVIDQLLLGWYGGFAVEMMALGKPVVCYLRREDLRFIPEGMRDEMPIIQADPASLLDVLTGLLESPERLADIGARSRRYVECWHDPHSIALTTKAAYEAAMRSRGAGDVG